MAKKGIRARRTDYVKRDLRELSKLGLDVSEITNGRSAESLAYSKRGYENWRATVRKAKSRNNLKEFAQRITDYEKERKQELYKEYVKSRKDEGYEVDKIEDKFIQGAQVKHTSDDNFLKLDDSFKANDYVKALAQSKDLKAFKKFLSEKESEIDMLEVTDIIDTNGSKFKKNVLADFVVSGKLDTDERDELVDLYQELNAYQKQYILSNIEDLKKVVESATLEGNSYAGDYLHGIKSIMVKGAKFEKVGRFKYKERDYSLA